MANLMHRFLKCKLSLRMISSFPPPHLSKLTPPLITHQKNFISDSESGYEDDPVPLINPIMTMNGKSARLLRFYPSFPFGYGLNPVFSYESGLVEAFLEDTEEHVEDSDDSRTVYADSVKKKRKRKMNKHKYKKLRKSLGRKT